MFEKIKDYIYVEKGIIPRAVCERVVGEIGKRDWRPHAWHHYGSDTTTSEATMELDVQEITPDLQNLLGPYLIQAISAYSAKFAFKSERTRQIMSRISTIRFNRYSPGQIMRLHQDHIHSLFDGREKGIPVLSLVGNLNDDYDGANLYFWDDYICPWARGTSSCFHHFSCIPMASPKPRGVIVTASCPGPSDLIPALAMGQQR